MHHAHRVMFVIDDGVAGVIGRHHLANLTKGGVRVNDVHAGARDHGMLYVVLREIQQAVEHHISILIQIAGLMGGIHDGFQVIGGGGGVHVFYRFNAKNLEDGIGRVLKEVDEPAE